MQYANCTKDQYYTLYNKIIIYNYYRKVKYKNKYSKKIFISCSWKRLTNNNRQMYNMEKIKMLN